MHSRHTVRKEIQFYSQEQRDLLLWVDYIGNGVQRLGFIEGLVLDVSQKVCEHAGFNMCPSCTDAPDLGFDPV